MKIKKNFKIFDESFWVGVQMVRDPIDWSNNKTNQYIFKWVFENRISSQTNNLRMDWLELCWNQCKYLGFDILLKFY